MSKSFNNTGTNIGNKIRLIRELRGLKQCNLATLINEKQQIISKIELSDDIDFEKLVKIANALDVKVETIMNFDENDLLSYSCIEKVTEFKTKNIAIDNTLNPLEKIIELYERLLNAERKKNEILESILREKGLLK